ncbi:MAG TPA: MogA/MoaB family molybdenum cofactor biosynthesis protein [Terriglobales bacterium]|nr:MogA/MoaB family molybdenum cofactor biosynthesis protein [Terriglobales bacterium]
MKPTSGAERLRAAVLTISDGCAAGRREDRSGPLVAAALAEAGFQVTVREVLPDEQSAITARLKELAQEVALVVTTGGTGFGPRDVTPEATLAASERLAPGLAELMRQQGAQAAPFAWLSRGVAGLRGATLYLNLPGSPRGADESLRLVLPLLPHALALLRGQTEH